MVKIFREFGFFAAIILSLAMTLIISTEANKKFDEKISRDTKICHDNALNYKHNYGSSGFCVDNKGVLYDIEIIETTEKRK